MSDVDSSVWSSNATNTVLRNSREFLRTPAELFSCAYLADVAEKAEVVVVVVVEVDDLQVVLHVCAVGVHRPVVLVAVPRVGVRVAEPSLGTGAF